MGMMKRHTKLVALLATTMLIGGCGNSVYGPLRVVQTGYLDNGAPREGGLKYTCAQPGPTPTPSPTPTPTVDSHGINLVYDFNRLACASINNRDNSAAAYAMMDGGFTLTRLRCNDFFAERAGNQMRARVWRGTIAPVSAVVAGIISLVNFSDGERTDAIQILGITQAATVAGFELYEQEFLFDAANVNSVRQLVMRALDEHAATAMDSPIRGFNHAVRHMMDNQMICTPANILDLVRASIAGGQVAARHQSATDQLETLARTNAAFAWNVMPLTDEQLGALWWLAQGGHSQDELDVIEDRLGTALSAKLLTGGTGARALAPGAQPTLAQLVGSLRPTTVDQFSATAVTLRTTITAHRAAPAIGVATAIDAARTIRFTLGGAGRAVEVVASPTG
jgi:hypothetical protein